MEQAMEEVGTLDFKALRAKFQKEDPLKKSNNIRPAPPEKPRSPPPNPPSNPANRPQNPTHYLPAGARPSLLSSISQSLEAKSATAPRMIFKEDKKEGKKEGKIPLIQSEGKSKKGKDKTKGSKDKLDEDPADHKQKIGKEKKLLGLPKESTKELVPGATPPQATLSKKKGFLGFKKPAKITSLEVPSADPIMDSPSSGGSGPAPLIPAPLIPAPLIPAPLIPAPLIQAPLIPTPPIPARQIPARQIPAPQIPAPLIPAPLIPAPLIPSLLIPALLIPAPSDFCDELAWAEPAAPRALPNIPTLPDSSADVEMYPTSPDFTPPPSFIPDAPGPEAPTPESETPLEIETPFLPTSRPASRNEIAPNPPGAAPTPPPDRAVSTPPPAASTPPHTPPELDELAVEEEEEEEEEEAVNIAEEEAPPPPPPRRFPPAATNPASNPPPRAERPVSALAALSRVEVLNPGKRTAIDQRIFNALEKARRKSSPPTNPSPTYSITPPLEEFPPSPTHSLSDLPPIDYTGNAHPSKPVNGLDHRQASPVLEGIAEEGSDAIPELLVVPPPPPPKRLLPDPPSLGPTPEKPRRPLSAFVAPFIPSPPASREISADPEFSEDLPEFESEWDNGEHPGPDTSDEGNLPELYGNGTTPPEAAVHADQDNQEPESSFPISQGPPGLDDVDNGVYESTEDAYEAVTTSTNKKKVKSDGAKKRKGTLKNPYAEAKQETAKISNEEKTKTGRFGKNDKKVDGPDEKELKKKEKQRLEKEKKELKEKQEREKKEQKEREKKENEMKKKFQITGQEDALYRATVTVANKGRKNDLPVNSGDVVSIIRTTNCPKGRWLARDSGNNCGYIAVDHVELDIKEMLELGKKAASNRMGSSNNVVEEVDARTWSGVSNQYPTSAESFTDDSEEWADEDPLTPAPEPEYPLVSPGHSRTLSMPDMGNKELSVNHSHSRSDIIVDSPDVQARHEALHKLATFFHAPKPEKPAASHSKPETGPVLVKEEEVPLHTQPETSPVIMKEEEVTLPGAPSTQEVGLDLADLILLPPPDFTGE